MMKIEAQHVKVIADKGEGGFPVGTRGILLKKKEEKDNDWCLVLGVLNTHSLIPLWHLEDGLEFGEKIEHPEDICIYRAVKE
mgnify:CR=1 FL=1